MIINKKLGGNVVIPIWLYRNKFGCEPDESMIETTITRHTPEKKQKVTSNEINELRNDTSK